MACYAGAFEKEGAGKRMCVQVDHGTRDEPLPDVMIRRLRKIWMHTQVEAAHRHPEHDPQVVVDAWLAEQPEVRIIFIDGTNKVALRAAV
jgi:hypothetical protein